MGLDPRALQNLLLWVLGFFSLQFSLMVTFPEVPLGIFLFCVCVIAIGAVQVGCPGAPPPLKCPLELGAGWAVAAVRACPGAPAVG